MSRLYRAITLLVAAAALTTLPLGQASANTTSATCMGPYSAPAPSFPSDLCDVTPHLCDEDEPIVVVVNTIIAVSKAASAVKMDAWHAEVGARSVIRHSEQMMQALQVSPSVAGPALTYIRQNARPMLDAVEAGQLSVGQFTAHFGNGLANAAAQGSASYQAASGGSTTVTTTTTFGFEINAGPFKVNGSQTVTTVETTGGESDDGYTTETDDDGNSVCIEDSPPAE